MSAARKILSNTAAQVISKALMAILGIVAVKILTNYLSENQYGDYVYVYELINFFGVVADLGIFTIAVKEMSSNERDIPKILGNILSLRTVLVVLAMLGAIGVAFAAPGDSGMVLPLAALIVSLSLFINTIHNTIATVLQTKLRMEIPAVALVVGRVVTIVSMIWIAFYGFAGDVSTGFFLMFGANVVGHLISFLATGYYVRQITPVRYRFDLGLWKRIFRESLPYGLALILNSIYFRVDAILIYQIRGSAELGVYGIGMKVLEQFVLIPMFFMNSVLPVLTKKLKEKSDQYKIVIRHSFDFLMAMSLPLVVGGVALAVPIVLLVSNADFVAAGSGLALQILLLALLFQFISVLFTFVLIALGKQKKLLYINGTCATLNVITNLIFIPIYGFVGAAVTSVVCELFILVATYIYARRYLDFELSFGNLGKILVASLAMGAVLWLVQGPLLLMLPLGVGIYVGLIWVLKVVDKDVLRMLKK